MTGFVAHLQIVFSFVVTINSQLFGRLATLHRFCVEFKFSTAWRICCTSNYYFCQQGDIYLLCYNNVIASEADDYEALILILACEQERIDLVIENHKIKKHGVGLFSSEHVDDGRQPNIFSILDEDIKKDFVSKCSIVTFEPGQSLFFQSDAHTNSYIIEDGLVRTYYIARSSREITLGYWSTGDLIGGPDVLGDGIHVWSATASRSSRVLAISGNALRNLSNAHPIISQWIIDVLRFKLRWLSILFQIHSTYSVEDRLIKILLLLAENYGENTPAGRIIKYKISQSDLGTLVGASRQWTNKKLHLLEQSGLLAIEKRQIILLDTEALRQQIQIFHE